ncbi:WAT1-related protein At1g09380-like [Nicotiana sylvestris]|uniref:WAT1-related protein At1g09380-like n=1 Tax=Nicotiana sylvestris TaxID=4096 RepID=UPI00388C8BA9
MVVVALLLGGNILLSKVAIEDGMSVRIMVAYRWIFSAAFLGPIALVVEWGSIFCNLFYASIELTSPVFVSAIDNLVPAMTIFIAILFRSEKLSLHKVSGKAKSVGTIICVTGAMGVLGSGIVVILMTWCSQQRGPLFVSIFNPMTLIFVALASAMLLDEALYVGSVIGGGLIIAGLYLVLWGKEKERKALNQSNNEEATHDVEEI